MINATKRKNVIYIIIYHTILMPKKSSFANCRL